jgi:acid phosphatase (class A)
MQIQSFSRHITVLATLLAVAGCATAPTPAPMDAKGKPLGYLAPSELPDTTRILPAAPVKGSARYEADRQVFLETRKLEGTPRWVLATDDVDLSVPAMLKHFSCAMDADLQAEKLPRLTELLERADRDADESTRAPKQANKRLRPFLIDEGNICQPKERLAKSYDYPSGHTTWGWTAGLIMAQLAPDRASELDLRARAFADSRVVCGAHNLSATQAGAINGAVVFNSLQAVPAYRADLVAARSELDAYRKSGPKPDGQKCEAERALIVTAPY